MRSLFEIPPRGPNICRRTIVELQLPRKENLEKTPSPSREDLNFECCARIDWPALELKRVAGAVGVTTAPTCVPVLGSEERRQVKIDYLSDEWDRRESSGWEWAVTRCSRRW